MKMPIDARLNIIRQNLTDRYKQGFPIIKELVQNADDSHATDLHMGWINRLPGLQHPLLKGPAIFVLNNGTFDKNDIDALDSIGLSSKSGSKLAVGKFGLGLKSIFHLCEAFFYLANSDKIPAPVAHIVNPWADDHGHDKFHDDWDNFFETDQAIITNHLKMLMDTDHYFYLWIPLRREAQLGKHHPIRTHYPGDTNDPKLFFYDDLPTQLATLIPLLRSLKKITGWVSNNGTTNSTEPTFIVELTGSTRRRYPAIPDPNKGRHLLLNGSNTVTIASLEKPHIHHYSGIEAWNTEDIFTNLQALEHWPVSGRTDPDTGEYKDHKDKADPHSAVCFIKHPAPKNNGRLTIKTSVFLPVDKPEFESNVNTGGSNYLLTLHGYFFLDAGRSSIDGLPPNGSSTVPTNEHELRILWNSLIARRGILPLVLPALDQFVRESNLNNIETELLTTALQKSTLFSERAYRDHLCGQHQWVCCVSKTGDESCAESWQLLYRDEPVFVLTKPPESDLIRPFKVFPAMEYIKHLARADRPRLSKENHPTPWGPKLATLMDSVQAKQVFSERGLLTYLVEFLEANAGQLTAAGITALKKLIRRVFQSLTPAELRKNKSLVTRFSSLLPPGSWIALHFGRDDNLRKSTSFDLVIAALTRLDLKILLIPDDLAPDDTGSSAGFTPADAKQLLNRLAEPDQDWLADPTFDTVRQELVLKIIDAVHPGQRDEVLSYCQQQDLQVFKAHDCSLDREVSVGLAELKQTAQENILFKNAVPPTPYLLLAPSLQKALRNSRVLVVSSTLSNLVSEQIDTCTANACLNTLASRPRLSPPEDRAELLRALLKQFDNMTAPTTFQGLRYLLHGQAHAYTDDGDLWLISGAGQTNKIWQRIANYLLAKDGQTWRLVSDTHLTGNINPNQLRRLNVQSINQNTLNDWLSTYRGQLSELSFPDKAEREQLLRYLSVPALKKLKVHETVDGDIVLIEGGRTYLEGNFDIGQALREKIILLRRHSDPEIWAKQGKLVGQLTAQSAIEIALKDKMPQRYWDVIMNALKSIGTLPGFLTKRLQEIAWLPLATMRNIKPTQVIHIPKLEEEIEAFVANSNQGWVSILDLDPAVVDHPAFAVVAKYIFIPQTDALKKLGEIIAEKEEYRVGNLDLNQFDTNNLRGFINTFFDNKQVMPIAAWMKGVEPRLPLQRCLTDLLPPLTLDISPERMIAILDFLAKEHKGSKSQTTLQFHRRYLSIAVEMPAFASQILPVITLLNQNGQWTSTSQLCFEASGIDEANLLDTEQGKIINPDTNLPSKDSTSSSPSQQQKNIINRDTWQVDVEASAGRLKEYFTDWEPFVDFEIIGTFLSYLGHDDSLVKLAENYLDRTSRKIDQIRDMFKWIPREQINPTTGKVGGYGQNAHDTIRNHRFIIDTIEVGVKIRRVTALTGQLFEAKLSSESRLFKDPESTIFVGDFRTLRDKQSGYQINRIGLRKLNIQPQHRDKLPKLLKRSTQKILKDFYWQAVPNFDDAWADIEHSEQLDIETAQEILIESAFFYLPQYGLRTDPHISTLLRRWREAHNRLIGDKRIRRVGSTLSTKSMAEKDQLIVQDELKECIEDKPEVRQAILTAVRTKIGSQFQYQRASVLFELFQNADDAVSELEQLYQGEQSLTERNRRIEVVFDNDKLVFRHWGRSVNQVYAGSTNGRNLGYGDDLTKMLTMQDSDKLVHANSGIAVTGKFGLGFKSVFLISDSPNVVSGRLGFKIIGGIYPLDLPAEDIVRLRNTLGVDSGKAGTVFELPFGKTLSPAVNLDEVTNDFQELIHIVLVFAKAIKQCEITDEKQRTHKANWSQETVLDLPGIYLDAWLPVTQISKTEAAALVLESNQGALLLKLGTEGIQSLPNSIPTIWVTVPTQEKHKVGFALNGLFDLDIGRAQLARNSSHNRTLADRIGEKLGGQLYALFNALEQDKNWAQLQAQFKEKAGIELSVDRYQFWHSLWQQLAVTLYKKEENEAIALLRAAFGFASHQSSSDINPPRGVVRLIFECNALPTELWHRFKTLTRLDKIKYVAQGTLDTEDVFCQVIQWPSFEESTGRIKSGEIISERVERVIKKLVPLKLKYETLTLKQVIGWEVGRNYNVPPEIAVRLGEMIKPDFMVKLSKEKPTEHEELRDENGPLAKSHFKCRDGHFHPASEIIILYPNPNSDERDETLRAHFAPDSKVLAKEYGNNSIALGFFRVCRQEMRARVKEELAEWALFAPQAKRKAVLDYLLHGIHAKPLATALTTDPEIKTNFKDSWLSHLSQHLEPLSQFTVDEQSELLGRLKLVSKSQSEPEGTKKRIQEPADKVLKRVYAWWEQKQATYIKKYETEVYPHGQPPVLRHDFDPDSIDDRKNWLTLLLLGSFYTMGRTIPQQHRSFLELCQHPDRNPVWFDVFSAPEQDSEQWIETLRQYIDAQVQEAEFYQWMKQFVSIFHLSHWMTEYVEGFLAVNRIKRDFELREITNLRTSPTFQHGGIEAPPITRPLGIGANFVLREMIRLRVINSEYAYKHCYVPTEKIRNFFVDLGCHQTDCTSPQVYSFLIEKLGPDKATFNLTFDIPFHYWLQNKGN
ncbi:MAG: hypothetical protein KDJ65_05960 [Anaerolineae bacterium]|nr:hypothetical protein [Anaerolineae bacterium]